jgi:hypothetical protein
MERQVEINILQAEKHEWQQQQQQQTSSSIPAQVEDPHAAPYGA